MTFEAKQLIKANATSDEQAASFRMLHEDRVAATVTVLDGALTFGSVIFGALEARRLLENFALNLEVSGNSIVASTGTQLSIAVEELKRKVGDRLTQSIESLGYDLKASANRLANATRQILFLLRAQIGCVLAEFSGLVAAINTVGENLKRGVLFVRDGSPAIHYFSFEGFPSGFVPRGGGRVEVFGHELFASERHPPIIRMLNESRTAILAEFVPQRGRSVADNFTILVSEDFLSQHRGRVVDLHVRAWDSALIGGHYCDLYVPMSIPSREELRVFATAKVTYKAKVLDGPFGDEANRKGFHFTNDRESEEAPFNETKVVYQDDKTRIVQCETTVGSLTRWYKRYQTAFTSSSITVTGMLDGAAGFHGIGHAHSCFSCTVLPIVVRDREEVRELTGQSTSLAFESGEVTLLVDLPKVEDFAASDWEFELWRELPNGGKRSIYKSPRAQAGTKGDESASADVDDMQVTAVYNPGVAARTAQIGIKCHVSGECFKRPVGPSAVAVTGTVASTSSHSEPMLSSPLGTQP